MLVVGLVAANRLSARNIDLSTVPDRTTVQLTIYNSEDLTLVRETRKVSFKKGVNPLQFSWANTLIDPSSVELRFLTSKDKLEVLDTTFPHDKPQMLYWNVQSEIDGEAAIEITYFTSGISWAADYVLLVDPAEKAVNFEGFVPVSNRSGEDYQDAQVRLVVGKINLVEKIAQLARIPIQDVNKLGEEDGRLLRMEAAKDAMNGPTGTKGAASGEGRAMAERQGNHQGGPVRVLRLHDRRDGNGAGRLVEADAEPDARRGPLENPVSLSRAGVWAAVSAPVPDAQRQEVETRHHAVAGWHSAQYSATTGTTVFRSSLPSRSSTWPSATRSS